MTNSIFDRLANQGTAASKARESEELQTRKQIERRKAAEDRAAAAHRANPTKIQNLKPPQDVGKSPKKTIKQQESFFDRLAKKETESSRLHHKLDAEAREQKQTTPKKQAPKKTTALSPKEKSAVFNRLYKQETAATKAHHVKSDAKTQTPKKKGKPAPPPSLLKRIEDKNKQAGQKVESKVESKEEVKEESKIESKEEDKVVSKEEIEGESKVESKTECKSCS